MPLLWLSLIFWRLPRLSDDNDDEDDNDDDEQDEDDSEADVMKITMMTKKTVKMKMTQRRMWRRRGREKVGGRPAKKRVSTWTPGPGPTLSGPSWYQWQWQRLWWGQRWHGDCLAKKGVPAWTHSEWGPHDTNDRDYVMMTKTMMMRTKMMMRRRRNMIMMGRPRKGL